MLCKIFIGDITFLNFHNFPQIDTIWMTYQQAKRLHMEHMSLKQDNYTHIYYSNSYIFKVKV